MKVTPVRVVVGAVLLGLALTFAPAPAQAQRPVCDSAAHVCVTLPLNWTTTMRAGVVVLLSPDTNLAVELRGVTRASQFAQARADFERQLVGRFTGLRWEGPATPAQQHGMTGVVRRGSGRFPDGRAMRFFMLALAHTTGGVVGLGLITQNARQVDFELLQSVLNTIRPQ